MKPVNLVKAFCAIVFASTSALSAIAAPEPRAPLEMTYDHDTREVPADQYVGTCPVRIVATVDARQNKETVGQSMNGALLSGDMSKWVSAGLGDLASFGLKVESGGDPLPPADGLLVKTSLTRAYIWHVGFKIFSMVALKAQFVDKNGVVQEKYYRAHGDKSNIWGADSEYVTTLNYGLNNLLPVMAKDISSLCKGVPVERYSYAGPSEPAEKK